MLSNVEKKEKLTTIIEMKTPDWLTNDVYQNYLKDFDFYQKEFENPNQFLQAVKSLPGVSDAEPPNLQWGYVDTYVTAEFFVKMWKDGRIISPPSTGQDPKTYSKSNKETASEHFANMWGDTNGSFWLREGVLNLVCYPGNQYVLEATDIEHRLWGIIGGALGYVPLKSDRRLYFKHPNIKTNCLDERGNIIQHAIQVNNLTIHQIVDEANKNSTSRISLDDILNRYYKCGHQFKLRLLPMYSDKQCHNFYGVLNKQNAKTIPQLLHSKTHDSNFWIKEHSSIKLERFTPASYNLHPFYKELFPIKYLMSLESFMHSHLIFQNVMKNYFVESTDPKIKKRIEDTFGYQKTWESGDIEDIKETVIQKLDLLYKFYSEVDHPKVKFSRQATQQILKCIDWVDDENHVIFDWTLFANTLYDFIETHKIHQSGPDVGIKTRFGVDMGASNIANYKSAFSYIKKNFLQHHIINNATDSIQIGVVEKSDRIPRLFSSEVIDDSEKKYNGKDIDNTPIKGRRVGGHRISDFELNRLTDAERVQAFIDEGLGDVFDFDLNCRAMSAYHNNRMGILRLSEYLKIMNESDDIVNQVKIKKKQLLSNKPLLV
jgi:hypothetical protein